MNMIVKYLKKIIHLNFEHSLCISFFGINQNDTQSKYLHYQFFSWMRRLSKFFLYNSNVSRYTTLPHSHNDDQKK